VSIWTDYIPTIPGLKVWYPLNEVSAADDVETYDTTNLYLGSHSTSPVEITLGNPSITPGDPDGKCYSFVPGPEHRVLSANIPFPGGVAVGYTVGLSFAGTAAEVSTNDGFASGICCLGATNSGMGGPYMRWTTTDFELLTNGGSPVAATAGTRALLLDGNPHFGGVNGDYQHFFMVEGIPSDAAVADWYDAWSGVAGAPSNLVATAGVTSMMLEWDAVVGALSYEVRIDGGAEVSVGLNDYYLFSGLTSNTLYNMEVRTISGAGASSWASISETTSSATFEVRIDGNAPIVVGTDLCHQFAGLTPGTGYVLGVRLGGDLVWQEVLAYTLFSELTSGVTRIRTQYAIGEYAALETSIVLAEHQAWTDGGTPLVFCHGSGDIASTVYDDDVQRSLVRQMGNMFVVGVGDLGYQTWGNDTAITRVEEMRTYLDTDWNSDGPIVLVGISMGALSALAYTLANPDRVQAVAIIIPALDINDLVVNNRGGGAAEINAAYGGAYNNGTDGPDHNPVVFAADLPEDLPIFLFTSSDDPLAVPATADAFMAARPQTTRLNIGALGHSDAAVAAAIPYVLSAIAPYA
jgi:pimeloyl-ACP methyl ester carboxylesterase